MLKFHSALGIAELGFAMTLRDVEDLFKLYVISSQHERGLKYLKHDWQSGSRTRMDGNIFKEKYPFSIVSNEIKYCTF